AADSDLQSSISHLPTPISNLRAAWLAKIRRECVGEEQWLQEYCCVPADEVNAFITFEMITACEEPGLSLLTFEEVVTYCHTGLLPAQREISLSSNGAAGEASVKDQLNSGRGEEAFPNQPSAINHQLYLGIDVASSILKRGEFDLPHGVQINANTEDEPSRG